ncbi:MAG TPA: DUF1345 domain-containing protein [Mucilaginibacter sp.]|jgi:uncharacterized membrane protein|nr:DUF1345 domain-containing protein [Mucilaginibacter sp.]
MTNITPTPHLFMKMDAHHRVMISLVAGVVTFLVVSPSLSLPSALLFAWMGFALIAIILMWITILSSHPREVQKIAKLQDSSRAMISAMVIIASVFSLLAVYFLLRSAKGHSQNVNDHILLSITAVFVSWWLVHTIFTLRYAHMYYDTSHDDGTPKPGGGLDFPGNEHPDYMDFVYFAFVIGMTFQVSDVEISAKHIRRLAWLHGLISFIFNTTIVALGINVISGLVSS